MNKTEFLQALEAGLSAASPEERVAAMQYYTEYLDDAGPERVAEAIQELGDPSQIAADILASSGDGKADNWMPPPRQAPSPEPAPEPPAGEPAGQQTGSAPGSGPFNQGNYPPPHNQGSYPPPYNQPYGQGGAPPPYSQPYGQAGAPTPPPQPGTFNQKNNNIARIIMFILLAILLSPLIGSGIGILTALIITLAVLLFCPVVLGIALIVGGIAVAIGGALLIPITVGSGLMTIGLGVFLAGLGMLITYYGAKWMGKGLYRVVNSIFVSISNLINRLLHRS